MTKVKAAVSKTAEAAHDAPEPTFTPRKDGSVRMANSKGWEYWMPAKDVDGLLALPNDKAWRLVPDLPDGAGFGPTGPPRK